MRPWTTFLLFLAVMASGCTHTGGGGAEKRTAESNVLATCDNVRIKIDQASATSAMFRQMNTAEVGNVEVRWIYQDGSKVTRQVRLEERGDLKMLQSGRNGELEKLEVVPLRCREMVETYRP